jgi:hypothetical protein
MPSGEGPCPAGDFERLIRERQNAGLLGWALGVPGLLLLGFGLLDAFIVIIPSWPRGELGTLLMVLSGLGLFCGALACYARCKGRSRAWGLLGLGCLPGLIVILFLPPLCGWCGRAETGRRFNCGICGGPL